MFLNKIFFILLAAFILFPSSRAEALFGISNRAAQKEMIEQAEAAYKDGDYKAVEEISREFLLKNPSASKKRLKTVYLLLGDAYKAEGQYDKALLTYNEAVEFLPKDEDVNLALGGIYMIGGLNDNAKEIYRKVLEINKENKKALLGLATAHYENGFFSRATQYYQEYEDSGEDMPAIFMFYYAMAQYMSNHSEIALELALKSLDKENNAETLLLIAKIYKSGGNIKEAVKYIDLALQKEPNRTDIYLTKGLWLAFELETAKQGLAMADTILKKDDKDKLALFIKYIALWRMGKEQQGKVYIKQIMDIEGDQFIDKISEKIYKNTK